MPRTLKIIFRASLALLILLIIAPIIGHFIPLQFANASDEDSYQGFRYTGILVCILLTLSGTIRKGDSVGIIVIKIAGTVFITGVVFFAMAATALDGMCLYTTESVLFVNKNNPSEKIILRSFGCGATDSTSPNMEVVKATYYTSHLFILSPIDTTKIDRTIWLPVHDNEQQ
jgi:predicted membrane channel-forming protein YqfA (hemolysin III family)